MVTTSDVEKVKFDKKPKVIAQQVVTKPPNLEVAKLKAKGKSLPKSQRGPKTQDLGIKKWQLSKAKWTKKWQRELQAIERGRSRFQH